MLFSILFLALFGLTWALLGGLVWIGLSLLRRARGALWALPWALAGGVLGGAATPLAGLDTGLGIGVSMMTAPLAAGAAVWGAYRVWDRWGLDRVFGSWARGVGR